MIKTILRCTPLSNSHQTAPIPLRDQPVVGTSVLELIIAMVVLATAVSGIGRFAAHARQGLRDRELSSRIEWELANAREQIGAWEPDTIDASRIKAIPFSPAVARQLGNPQWKASVIPITDPTDALQITLTLSGTLRGQAVEPATLVFWIDRGESAESQSEGAPKSVASASAEAVP